MQLYRKNWKCVNEVLDNTPSLLSTPLHKQWFLHKPTTNLTPQNIVNNTV